jgi:hypothetical protein
MPPWIISMGGRRMPCKNNGHRKSEKGNTVKDKNEK